MKRTCLLVACLSFSTAGLAVAQEEKPDKAPDLKARLKKVKGPFSLIVTFQVKKGEENAMLEAAAPCIAASVKETGCKRYELNQDLEDPTRFVLLERWDSVKDLDAHLTQPHTRKMLAELGKIVAGPPKMQICKRRSRPR